METIGTPERSLFHVERYNREGGMANIQTKRGCPFSCIYCTYPLLEGSRVRLRPVDEIIAEIRELVERYGVDYLYFVDDIFNYPAGFRGTALPGHDCADSPFTGRRLSTPSFITPDLLAVMVEAGCDAVEFGTRFRLAGHAPEPGQIVRRR